MRVSRQYLNIRPCASTRDEYAGSNHEMDGFQRESPFLIRTEMYLTLRCMFGSYTEVPEGRRPGRNYQVFISLIKLLS